jgi:hypothetical protein
VKQISALAGIAALVVLTAGAAAATRLTFGELTGAAPLSRPVDMQAFAPGSAPPSNRFEGSLSLVSAPAGVQVLRDDYGDFKNADAPARRLPAFDFAFVQSGDVLIPVRRGTIVTGDREWDIVLEPGRVWDEPGDQGYSRASLPFALEERNANCMHNGVLTFLFKTGGAISDVVFEIGSEPCLYAKFNMWGRLAARYVPAAIQQAGSIAAAYRFEIEHRMPTRPIADLARDFPGIDPSRFGSADEIKPPDMTTYGVVVKGVNYVGACDTRLGAYPFCGELDLPSYSLAKSIFAGLASMRLSLLYPGIMGQTIAPYVPACAAAGTWNDVTFADTLDMATGHYISSADQLDEGSPDIMPFFFDDTHSGRIAFACTHYPRKAQPGSLWVYHTADVYILGTALRAFYRGKTSPDAPFYKDVLADPLWHRLHLDPAIDVTRRSNDAAAQPFTGWGLTFHRDDVAKLADFLNVNRGAIDGVPAVDQAMLAAALQRDPNDHGLPAAYDSLRYKYGFWAWNAGPALGCKAPAWIPFMSGFGGIVVALMPNGITYYYFSDGGTYRWADAVKEASRISPICTGASHAE